MGEKLKQEIALFKYSLIAPLVAETYTQSSAKEYLEEISSKEYLTLKVNMFKQIQESIYTYQHMKNITPVIIVDEAQFPTNSVLDDFKTYFNFKMDSKDYAILVLAGQTPFITQLSRQAHEALRQRIVVNYCLHGLTKDETKEYIKSRLDKAGCFEPLFTDNAHELLFSSSNGSIRTLNSLVKMCLVTSASEKLKSIDKEIVFTALNELNIMA